MSLRTTQYDKGQLSVRMWGQEVAVASCSAQPRRPGRWMFSENYCFILKLPLLYIVPSLMHF